METISTHLPTQLVSQPPVGPPAIGKLKLALPNVFIEPAGLPLCIAKLYLSEFSKTNNQICYRLEKITYVVDKPATLKKWIKY